MKSILEEKITRSALQLFVKLSNSSLAQPVKLFGAAGNSSLAQPLTPPVIAFGLVSNGSLAHR